jgi:superfamily II helicase
MTYAAERRTANTTPEQRTAIARNAAHARQSNLSPAERTGIRRKSRAIARAAQKAPKSKSKIPPHTTEGVKVCKTCTLERPLTDFWRDPRCAGGFKHTCTPCKMAALDLKREKRHAEATLAETRRMRDAAALDRLHERDPRVHAYRTEYRRAMKAAKALYNAWLKTLADAKKAGRPKRMPSLELKSDPRDALIHALNGETVQR